MLLQIVYTASKSTFSIVLTWNDLASMKHLTDAEVADAYKVCQDSVDRFGTKIASINVDNAAKAVAGKVAEKFAKEGCVILVIRDPSHCIDLCSKDLAKTKVVSRVLDEATEVKNFVKIDRIDSIRTNAMRDGDIEQAVTAVSMVDTRM